MRCCRCILCNRSPLRRSSYDSTSRSPCNAILSASNSCTRHINDSSSRSVSESRRLGRFCDKYKQFWKYDSSYSLHFEGKLSAALLHFPRPPPVVGQRLIRSLSWTGVLRIFPVHVRCNSDLTTPGACSVGRYPRIQCLQSCHIVVMLIVYYIRV